MTKVSTYEAKTHFSALLERVSKGEIITITKHGQEIARLSPIQTSMTPQEAVEKLKVFGKTIKAKATLEEIQTWKEAGQK